MGQRSQIYVRYENQGRKDLIANYYRWNYGERMISRARWGIEFIKSVLRYDWYFTHKTNQKKLSRFFDTNFDMKDIQMSNDILSEYKKYGSDTNFNNFVFKQQNNNDGKLLIDITDGAIKYAFLDQDANSGNIMDANGYMTWDLGVNWDSTGDCLAQEIIDICKDNIAYITENAKLMSMEEVEDFVNFDYLGQEDSTL